MKDKLIVINLYKELISSYCKLSLTYPRKHYFLKDMLEDNLFTYLEELYIINDLSNKSIRINKKEEMIGKLKYLNYLFKSINNLNIISDKQYKVIYIKTENIYKYLIGWVKSDR